ncbi:autophagy-related protein 2 homolog A-like [Homarus americanus]|uniref:Autophagy-related protein 2 n=1 Tax=Homarus americanus TaxID=6706 RepID=A0A8J5JSJ3_HOMAM|nr:autophagy-related protein 2 homolog A-like [Homarus americanus]KAG7163547.1 Autophagy-related protein 2 B-like [Homarus americanus]
MLRLGLETISKMPWYFPWSDAIKKRAIRYLLQRYVGQFLEEKLSLDQLTIDLYNGTGTIKELTLDVGALNEVADQLNLPLRFVDGYIGEICVSIPWHALLSENCFVEVSGLMVTIEPKQRSEDISMVDSMIESMSMTTSMQIAQECLNHHEEESEMEGIAEKDTSQTIEGIEHFAQAIDTVLNRIKVRFLDTIIRLEHTPKGSQSGVSLEIRIKKIDYFDEAGLGKTTPTSESNKAGYEQPAFASKKFHIEGLTMYTDEFPAKSKGLAKSVIIPSSESNSSPESGSKVSGSGSGDSFKTAETSPAEDRHFEYNHEKTVRKLITSSCIPMEPILFAKFTGSQEISLKLKQADVMGPKVDLRMNCGSLIMFLSPRQIHLLLELSEGVASPDKLDLEPSGPRSIGGKQKPMDPNDFRKVENELLKELRTPHVSSHALNQHQGWSSTPLDSDDEFVPMSSGTGGLGRNMSSSQLSGCSDMDSSFSSNMSGSTVKSATPGASSTPTFRYTGVGVMVGDHAIGGPGRKKSDHGGSRLTDDPSAVVTHLRVQISSLAAVILHEDVLTPSINNSNMVSKASVAEMQAKSEDFFSTLGVHGLSGYSFNVFQEARKRFSEACQINHLRFMAAPLTIEGSEKSLANRWEMSVNMSLGCAEILECLVDSSVSPVKVEYSDLLSFKESIKEPTTESVYSGAIEPKLRISISQSQNMTPTGRTRRMSTPKLDIKVNLGDCVSEIDMSIVDRISALINRQEVCTKATEEVFSPELPPSYINNQACFKQTLDDATLHPETRVNVKVFSSSLTVKLRFPIPDLTPTSNMDRVPWWKRNIRKDVLSLVLQDFEFVTTIDPHMPYSSYEIRSSDIHVYFQEREEDAPISLVQASSSRGAERGFDLPRVVVMVHPMQPWASLEDEAPRQESIMTKSMMGFLEEVSETEPNPFSRRKVATQQAGDDDVGEITIPADKEEVLEFMENILKNVQLHIEIHLPNVQLILPSKHIYEVVYNRLVSDLLLWEPSAPKPASHSNRNLNVAQGGLDLASVFMNESIYQSTTQFTMCTSANAAGGSDSEEEGESQFFSVYEHKARQRLKQQQQEPSKNKKQTTLAFKLTMGHGVASIRTPYRDAKNNVLPGQHGEVMLVIDQGTIFAATGYQGSPDLGYTCIWANKGHIYHRAANITPDRPLTLDPESPLSTSRLDAILYPNDDGVITRLGAGVGKSEDCQDQITLALKMDFDVTRNLKTIILAGCVRGATLRHYMCSGPESWVTQLGDMFDVQDYPLAGYVLPDVVTEMNFHLWGCALDYRPLYLPLRAMLTVDACSISSNLTISSDANVLHFIIEDAALFLSDKLSMRTVDLKKNYVCVADLGVFELCLRMVEDLKENKPKIDLLASNNVIHIRTCADSCKALLELLIYLASDGDLTKEVSLTPTTVAEPTSTHTTSAASSPTSECATMKPSETQETIFNPRLRENDSQQLEMVRGMMDDAMIESTPSTSSCEDDENDPSLYLKKGVEVFFFPDDNMKQKQNAASVTNIQKDTTKPEETTTETELTDTEYALKEALKEQLDNPFEDCSSGTDEEFCILDDAPGTGIKSPSGEPQVRLLTQDPIIIIDNHFTVPLGKVDQLRAPKHFPASSMKYTLQELTVVWHMYGGSDFKTSSHGIPAHTRRVTINDSNGNVDSVCGNYATTVPSPKMTYIPTEPCVTVRAGEVHFSSGHTSPTMFKKSPPHSPQQRSHMVWQAVGGPGRKHDILLELQLSKVRFQHEIYPETAQQASRNVLLIHDVEIRDRLTSSKINKFLYQFSSETCPRQAHANMVQVKALTTRPDGQHGPQETSLKISLQPIRLHVDQDALLFLFQFFEELLVSDSEGELGEEERPLLSTQVQAPIMTVNLNQAAQLNITDNQQLLVNLEEKSPMSDTEEHSSKADENAPPYFKSFVFSPDVPIKIDYHGKHVDIHSQYGPVAGLIIGLGQLNQSELTLKSIVHKSGLLGIDRLIQYITNEWVNDIRRNQLPSVLGGVGPMHSVGKLVGGVRDLFLLPIEQYQKDGRLVRGLQRGTSAFTTSSAHAALDLTGRFVGFIQSTAETMYDMVSSGPSVRHRYRLRGGQPQDIREGVTTAYGVVRDGIGDTASAIVQAATQEHQQKGVSGAIGGVLRQIPPTVMQPIILASEAAGTVIGGMKNQLVPDARREAADKWKA